MSHQVLARKCRPKSFDTLVGQATTVQILKNALSQNRLHQAYLFTGTRGVGKTTLARILAKCLNCLQGISPEPCNTCDACLAIDRGDFPDLIEVDAASRTKVEETRALLDNVPYAPTRGRFKVYLIDEVHMLSTHSFNALLKTLEEPPAHVKFLLATTDPQKLPATVLSRCLQFHLNPISTEVLSSHLANILNQENIAFEPNALVLLARAAKGSARDSLSLLEQAIGYGNGEVTADSTQSMLGLSSSESLLALLDSILKAQAPAVIEQARACAQEGVDFAQLLAQLIAKLHQLSLAQLAPEVLDPHDPDLEKIKSLAKQADPQDIQLCYQIALKGQEDLSIAPDPQLGFEMVVLRMVAFVPLAAPMLQANTHTPLSTPVIARKEVTKQSEPKEIASPTARNDDVASARNDKNHSWSEIWPKLSLSPLAKSMAECCTQIDWQEGLIKLALGEAQKPLLTEKRREQLNQAVNQYLGKSVRLQIEVSDSDAVKVALLTPQELKIGDPKQVEKIKSNQGAQALLNAFDATLEKVEPIERIE